MYKIYDSRYCNLYNGVIEQTEYLTEAKRIFIEQVKEVMDLYEVEYPYTVHLIGKDGVMLQTFTRAI